MDTGPPNFTTMPEKAVACILEHLNVWNLMNLRLLCKTTKSWVEKLDILKRLVVHVKERSFLNKLLKSSVKWGNMKISCDTMDMTNGWIRSEEYLNAFEYFKSSLVVLKFDEQRLPFNDGLSTILSQCSTLEELCIGTLDLTNASASLPLSKEIVTSLTKLKNLRVNYTAWETEDDLQFFPHAFEKCTNVEYLKLPYILSARLYSLYPTLEEDEVDQKLNDLIYKFLLNPVKNSLLKDGEKCKLKWIDVENFELEQIFESLASVCLKTRTLFMNVVETFEKPFTEKEQEYCGTIASLLNCTKYLDLNTLINLHTIAILDDCAASSDLDKKFEQAKMPCLKSVTLTLTKSILVSARFASCFLQQKRQSVEYVDIKFEDLMGSAQASVLRLSKFVSSFPNLRSLNLNGFDGKPEEYLLFWNSFPLLECLQLVNCRTLNDLSLTGQDIKEPVFLNLKYLKRLTLEDGDVSDAGVELVLAKIPLESLVLALPKVTMSGLSSLKASRMVSSLMQFLCMKPECCSEKDMKVYFSAFPNLKKYENLF